MQTRHILILGSTGSIGTQALQVVSASPERFAVTALCAHRNAELLFDQVRQYRPLAAALTYEVPIPEDLRGCAWYFGQDALERIAGDIPCEDVLVAVSGMIGLRSVLAARQAGRRVLLANKEALVAGGQLVMDVCRAERDEPVLLPVDSEHSAIFQCLQGEQNNPYRTLILTASGGPFLRWPKDRMLSASVQDALKHPNWLMGAKISIDSATMFNKALEVIEAKWLFDASMDAIRVLVHPQSIVHSMVEFSDGALLAQLGVPDMRVPIQYAMSYPGRLDVPGNRLQWEQLSALTFEQPDTEKFPSIAMAYQALEAGGAASCVLNAANEEAVAAFLKGDIPFGDIFRVVDSTLQTIGSLPSDTLGQVEEADRQARRIAHLHMRK